MWICDPRFLEREPLDIFHRWADDGVKIPETPEELKNRHWLVRRTFGLTGAERFLEISADDYCKFYINGRFVAQGPAQGYPDAYPYMRCDIAPFLQDDENLLAIHVYHNGCITRSFQSGDLRQGLWFRVTDENGGVIFESDGRCRALHCAAWLPARTIGYDTQFVEKIDASLLPEGWTRPDFDDSGWDFACENPGDDHTLVLQQTRPVDTFAQKPRSVESLGGVIRGDMGEEVVGSIVFDVCARSGEKLLVRAGEELNDDGSVRYDMRCYCYYQNEWTLSGRECDHVEFFDYMTFRYFEICAPAGAVDMDSLHVEARHYPMDESACLFETDDEDANRIFDICRRGVKLGTQEVFMDCPSRERAQYLGDGTITAQAHLLLTGDPAMYRKMLLDFAGSAKIDPGLMAVAPGGAMQEIADYSCQYPEQLLTYYNLTGDIGLLRELMPVVDGIEDYFDAYRNRDGLIETLSGKWNLVDWPENLRDGYDFPLTIPTAPGVHNVINAFYYGLRRDANRLRRLLGEKERGGLGELREAYVDAFRMEDGLFRDAPGSVHSALHSNVLPLYYGITAPSDVPAAVALIRDKGLCCGVYMAYFVLKALVSAGRRDLMGELLLNDSIHSWKNMLREGATTCYEAWGKEQKDNTSLCHPWASAPVIMMLTELAGLHAVSPGELAFGEPYFPDGISHIRARVKTPQGFVATDKRR